VRHEVGQSGNLDIILIIPASVEPRGLRRYALCSDCPSTVDESDTWRGGVLLITGETTPLSLELNHTSVEQPAVRRTSGSGSRGKVRSRLMSLSLG